MKVGLEAHQWTRRDACREFAGLGSPSDGEVAGEWSGAMVGRPALARTAEVMALGTPLRAWCGKRFAGDGTVVNRVLRRGSAVEAVVGVVSTGPSLLDGNPALIVTYRRTAPPPVRWMRGEVRWLEPGESLLGMLFLPIRGKMGIGPFPFLLTRPSPSPDAAAKGSPV